MIDPAVKAAIHAAVAREPFAQALRMALIHLDRGHSVVEMTYDPSVMNNIYARARRINLSLHSLTRPSKPPVRVTGLSRWH